MQNRVHVSMEDFLRVAIVQRDKFPTQMEAAIQLGLTESSFKQRYIREKKRYPQAFTGVPNYPAKTGNQLKSIHEVLGMLESLKGEADDN